MGIVTSALCARPVVWARLDHVGSKNYMVNFQNVKLCNVTDITSSAEMYACNVCLLCCVECGMFYVTCGDYVTQEIMYPPKKLYAKKIILFRMVVS